MAASDAREMFGGARHFYPLTLDARAFLLTLWPFSPVTFPRGARSASIRFRCFGTSRSHFINGERAERE